MGLAQQPVVAALTPVWSADRRRLPGRAAALGRPRGAAWSVEPGLPAADPGAAVSYHERAVRFEQLDLRPVLAYFPAAVLWLLAQIGWRGFTPRSVVLALGGTFSNNVMIGLILVELGLRPRRPGDAADPGLGPFADPADHVVSAGRAGAGAPGQPGRQPVAAPAGDGGLGDPRLAAAPDPAADRLRTAVRSRPAGSCRRCSISRCACSATPSVRSRWCWSASVWRSRRSGHWRDALPVVLART